MIDRFYDHKKCLACGGDGVSNHFVRPLPPVTFPYPPCHACKGDGRERVPLKWCHPLFSARFEWRYPKRPVVTSCVIPVDRDVQVVLKLTPTRSIRCVETRVSGWGRFAVRETLLPPRGTGGRRWD